VPSGATERPILLERGFLGFHSNGGIAVWVPLFLFVVLFGLSMDYHVFIISRIREAVDRGTPTEDAVSHGIRRGVEVGGESEALQAPFASPLRHTSAGTLCCAVRSCAITARIVCSDSTFRPPGTPP